MRARGSVSSPVYRIGRRSDLPRLGVGASAHLARSCGGPDRDASAATRVALCHSRSPEPATCTRARCVTCIEVQDGHLLMVASRPHLGIRLLLLTPGIPDKGEILTRMSLWWFDQLATSCPTTSCRPTSPSAYAGRALIVRAAPDVPGRVCRARLSHRLGPQSTTTRPARCAACRCRRAWSTASRLPEPIFTPATKAEMGEHDENVSSSRSPRRRRESAAAAA